MSSEKPILLVEDNELDARLLTKRLSEIPASRFRVDRVSDLTAAIDALQNGVYLCVLLDLSLPDSEGLATLTAITDNSDVPIVVLTGYDDPKMAFRAVSLGAQDYLAKSQVTTELVERAIRYSIARHQSEAELKSATELVNLMRERERIGRDLHDTVIQQLFATGMALQALAAQKGTQSKKILTAVDEIDSSIRHLREAIFGLHSKNVERDRKAEIVDIMKSQTSSLGFEPALSDNLDLEMLPQQIFGELRSVISEALSNVAQHASATSVEVRMLVSENQLFVSIEDNGVGYDTTNEATQGIPRRGLGLANLAERAEELGGRFKIGKLISGGTIAEWAVPLEQTI